MEELIQKLKLVPISYFVLGGILLGGLYYSMYFDTGEMDRANMASIQEELTKVRSDLQAIEQVIGDRQKFEQEYNQVSDQFRAAIEYLPSNFNIQTLLKQIYSEARSAGISLEKTKPKGSNPNRPADLFYDELMIEVSLVGSYAQLTLFLSYISRLQRIVNIRDIEIKFERVADEVPYLKMDGVLVSYKYLEGR